ncbi:MAG: type II toxin-antitoxin system HicA family toxin [Patescibacteria group bacterium]
MSERLPRLTSKHIIAVLDQRGFLLVRQSGSHQIFRNEFGIGTTVPIHGSKILHPKLLKSIL